MPRRGWNGRCRAKRINARPFRPPIGGVGVFDGHRYVLATRRLLLNPRRRAAIWNGKAWVEQRPVRPQPPRPLTFREASDLIETIFVGSLKRPGAKVHSDLMDPSRVRVFWPLPRDIRRVCEVSICLHEIRMARSPYIIVDMVESAIQRAESGGGRIVRPFDVLAS